MKKKYARKLRYVLSYLHVLFINVVSKGFVSSVVEISISFTVLFIPFFAVSCLVFATLIDSLVFGGLTVLNFLYFLESFFNVYFLFIQGCLTRRT